MTKPRNLNGRLDASAILSDLEFDPEAFIDAMEDGIAWRSRLGTRKRGTRRLIAELHEIRKMLEELFDCEHSEKWLDLEEDSD